MQALCQAAGDVVDAMLKSVNKDPEDDPPLEILAGLYSDKTAGAVVARPACRPAFCARCQGCISRPYDLKA